MKVQAISVVVLAALVSGQTEITPDVVSDCPEPNGFFADIDQCDKYYACVDGVITEKVCEDGLGFVDKNSRLEKCEYLFKVDCTDRPLLQPPKATVNCPRQNGYFPHGDPGKCSDFFYCSNGKDNAVTCPSGLLFSPTEGICTWPDKANREGCTSEKTGNFTCPTVSDAEAGAHPRYPDPSDCQFFYVCISGKEPRRNGCNFGQVFNSETKACDKPKSVLDCKEYYYPFFDEAFSATNTEEVKSTVIAAAIDSEYPLPKDIDERVRRPVVAPKRKVNPNRRRRPAIGPNGVRRRKTTTTTTTEAPAYYDDYYYYDGEEYPAEADPTLQKASPQDETAPRIEAPPPKAAAPSPPRASRPNFRRPSA